jgi:hypothetical protein
MIESRVPHESGGLTNQTPILTNQSTDSDDRVPDNDFGSLRDELMSIKKKLTKADLVKVHLLRLIISQ